MVGSSKSHHGCDGYRADLKLDDRVWVCPRCGRLVDRNANAALNLRDWTGAVDIGKADADGHVQRGGVAAPVPHVAAQAGDPRRAGSRAGVGVRGPARPPRGGGACDTRTEPARGEEPRTGVPAGECHKHLWIW
jgi:hypothetical protein